MLSRIALLPVGTLLLVACPGSATQTTSPPTVVKPAPLAAADDVPVRPHPAPTSIQAIFAAHCRKGLDKAKTQLPALVAMGGKRTVENFLDPYNEMIINVSGSNAIAGLMQSVHPNPKIRDAARACERDIEKFVTELKLNRKIYDAFVAVDTKGLDADTVRFVTHSLRDFRRAGVDRDEKTRTRLKQIDGELTKLGQQFSKNIVDDVRYIALDGVSQLAGLPADFVKAHKPGKDGKIKITTNYPDYFPFLTYADDVNLRKQIYIKARSRGGDKNATLLGQILALRHEKATALGFKTWADYITADKMMKSAKNAQKFIARVVKASTKRAKRDYKELLTRKRKDKKFRRAKAVADYEKMYLSNKVKKENYAFDALAVRPYFSYEQVEAGLLDITSKIYDVTYKRVPDADVWHTSVKTFDVMRGGKKIGRIFLDMHPRDGKYKHAAQFTKLNGIKGKQAPEGVLVCNFPDPKKGDALMEHGDVVTMFHEFGHLMHHIFGGQDQKWLEQSGVATEWDFVEAPSQMFEEWAWSYDTLKLFAKHYKTGAVIPKDLVTRMRRADKFGLGLTTVQQMFYASVSLNFHNMDPAKLDMDAEVKRLQHKLTPFKFVEGTKFHASFGHLNGYTALYYTYMWSLVIAKDMLTPFQKHGVMNTTWTHRYRDKILAPGGTKDAADLVKDFLGREYNFKAFQTFLNK